MTSVAGIGEAAEVVAGLRRLADEVSMSWSRDPLAREAAERMLEAAAWISREAGLGWFGRGTVEHVDDLFVEQP